jgi:imidazole glycerol-phosphate synthase subunit HisH
MKIAIVSYRGGNTLSLSSALERLGTAALVTDDSEELRSADRILLPGVGEMATAMESIRSKGLEKVIPRLTAPVLGICLGLQLMCKRSEEGDAHGLGIFDLEVTRFGTGLKVPHMGWNELSELKGPLFCGVAERSCVYFVHSFRAAVAPETSAVGLYGGPFSAAISKENFFGVQFHPEKSGETGLLILNNFLRL